MLYFPFISTCHCLHPGRSPPGFPRRPGGGGLQGLTVGHSQDGHRHRPSPSVTPGTQLCAGGPDGTESHCRRRRDREREENKGHGWGNWATCCKTAAEKRFRCLPRISDANYGLHLEFFRTRRVVFSVHHRYWTRKKIGTVLFVFSLFTLLDPNSFFT